MKFVATAAAILTTIATAAPSIAAPAPQRDWYVLDFNSDSCVSAKKLAAPTPELYHEGLRNMGVIDEVKVYKDDAGGLLYVAIIATIPPSGRSILMWFPSAGSCAMGKSAAQASGAMPDNSDLK